jgi:hypothetical protein
MLCAPASLWWGEAGEAKPPPLASLRNGYSVAGLCVSAHHPYGLYLVLLGRCLVLQSSENSTSPTLGEYPELLSARERSYLLKKSL